jgi:hypothetical protein
MSSSSAEEEDERRSPVTLNVEPPETEKVAVYVSREPVTEDASALPLVARRIYTLVALRDLVEERLNSADVRRHIAQVRGKLSRVNEELRLPYASREPFVGDSGERQRLAKRRDDVLVELAEAESTPADDRYARIEPWAEPYLQLPEPLTAYRPYRVERGAGYALYVEENVLRARAIVVCEAGFVDGLARRVIAKWCTSASTAVAAH